MNKLIKILIIPIILIPPISTHAQTPKPQTVKIGVLANRGAEQALKEWSPMAEYLTQNLHGYSFTIVPYDLHSIQIAAKNAEVDFIITNPLSYVTMEYMYNATRILTAETKRGDLFLSVFAGVVFTKSDRDDINTLDDLQGKTVMVIDSVAFGGYLMTARELKKIGIVPEEDFKKLLFSGFPHDSVVYAVLNGTADVGMARSGILESMSEEGEINLSDVKVINSQAIDGFPFLHSTNVYPEWALARLKNTPLTLSENIVTTLLQMPHHHVSLKAAGYAHWTIPLDYTPVHELMKELRVGPYKDYGKITFGMFVQRYWFFHLLGIFVIVVLVFSYIYVTNANRKLKRFNELLEERVNERTSELNAKNIELQKVVDELKESGMKINEQLKELQTWQQVTLGRENRIIELKKEVNELLKQLGKPLKYES